MLSRNSPGFDPNIFRHNGIWGAADDEVMKTLKYQPVYNNKKIQKITLFLLNDRKPLHPYNVYGYLCQKTDLRYKDDRPEI